MGTPSRIALLALIAIGIVSIVAAIARHETTSDLDREPSAADETSGVGVTRQSSGSGDAPESAGPARSRSADGELAGHGPASRDDGESKDPEEAQREEGSGPRPGTTGSEPMSVEERRRQREDRVAERKRKREQNQSESVDRFRTRWEAESQLEIEMGSESYDQMLYDRGDSNRVTVGWFAPDSVALQAGLQRGDELLSYDGIRIYQEDGVRWRNLLAEPGQPMTVEYIRDGELYETVIIRDSNPEQLRGNSNGMRFEKKLVAP